MRFALAGNQNCGKTTLFNALTGSNQHVGNFPGVTVEQKVGDIKGQKNCTVVDLPGIYSLRPYTQEEIVTRARKIGTMETSILPYEDCCTVFTPKHPNTKPKMPKILEAESNLDVEALVDEAVKGVEIVHLP